MILAGVFLFAVLVVLIQGAGYQRILYENNTQPMALTAAVIEKQIEAYEDLTLTIATAGDVQAGLTSLRSNNDRLEWSRARRDLVTAVLRYDPWIRHISSIRLYDLSGEEIIAGRDPYELGGSARAALIADAADAEGRSIISVPGTYHESLVISRQIRSTANLELKPLGTIAVFIDMQRLLEDYEQLVEGYSMNIYVFDDDRLVGVSEPEWPARISELDLVIPRGYGVVRIGGSRYFVATNRSTQTGWRYFSSIPFDAMYRRLLGLSLAGLALLLATIPIVLVLASRLARRLTIPIVRLSKQVRKVESGDFDFSMETRDFAQASDEVRHLHQDFSIALNRIRELAKDEFQRKLEIQDARFRILQSQINPHFLYNTLDTVNWMAKSRGMTDIAGIAKSLGNLLRSSLASSDHFICLSAELSLLADYLNIQSTRFDDRLVVTLAVDEEVQKANVPSFLLQPLVENSIAYALETGPGRCKVEITAERVGDELRIVVVDDGPGFPGNVVSAFEERSAIPARGTGIGLANIRDRIESLFDKTHMAISNGSGAEVAVRMPFVLNEGGSP